MQANEYDGKLMVFPQVVNDSAVTESEDEESLQQATLRRVKETQVVSARRVHRHNDDVHDSERRSSAAPKVRSVVSMIFPVLMLFA